MSSSAARITPSFMQQVMQARIDAVKEQLDHVNSWQLERIERIVRENLRTDTPFDYVEPPDPEEPDPVDPWAQVME